MDSKLDRATPNRNAQQLLVRGAGVMRRGVRAALRTLRWRPAPAVTPYALYHEAKNAFHYVDSSAGPVLLMFSARRRAKNFALAGELRGFLPAPLGPKELGEEFDALIAGGFIGFLVDPRMSRRQARVFQFLRGRPKALRRSLVAALRRSRRLYRQDRRAVTRQFRAHGRRALELGRLALEYAEFDEAAEYFERARARDAAMEASALSELGRLAHLRGRLDDSVALLLRAIDALPETPPVLDGDPVRPHALLGGCYRALGRTDEALAAYREAWARSPRSPDVGLLYARNLMECDRAADSALVLASLYERYPEHPAVRSEYATWMTHRQQFGRARDIRTQLAVEHPGDTENLLKLALLCDVTDSVELGFKTFGRVIVRSGDPLIIRRFHVFCARQGLRSLLDDRFTQAVRCFRTLTNARPELGYAQLGLALALAALDTDAAEVQRVRDRAQRAGVPPRATRYDLTEDALLGELSGDDPSAREADGAVDFDTDDDGGGGETYGLFDDTSFA